jgi:hypothetical protein
MRTDADHLPRVRDPTIELLFSHAVHGNLFTSHPPVYDCFSPRSLAGFYEGFVGVQERLDDSGGWHKEPFTADSTKHVSVYSRW